MAYAERRGNGQFPWSVRFKRPDGRWDRASGFADRASALAHGLDMESDIRRRRWRDPDRGAITFAQWAEEWMAAQRHSAVTAADRRRHLRLRILPALGHRRLDEITRWDVRTWASGLQCAPVSVAHCVTLVSTILGAAVEDDRIDANPAARLRLTAAGGQRAAVMVARERLWAYPEDAVAIAARLPRRQALMVVTAAFTGMRYGELAGLAAENCCLLRRDRLDGRPWLRHVIRVDPVLGALHETTVPDEDGVERTRLWLGPPKPPNGAREVDLPPFLAALLSAFLAEVEGEAPVADSDGTEARLVFRSPAGRLLRRSNWSRLWRRATGVPSGTADAPGWEPLCPGLELHGLRHGHRTAMEEDGVAQVLMDEQMGHERGDGAAAGRAFGGDRERASAMGRRYTHVTARMRRARLDALEARWRAAGGVLLHAA